MNQPPPAPARTNRYTCSKIPINIPWPTLDCFCTTETNVCTQLVGMFVWVRKGWEIKGMDAGVSNGCRPKADTYRGGIRRSGRSRDGLRHSNLVWPRKKLSELFHSNCPAINTCKKAFHTHNNSRQTKAQTHIPSLLVHTTQIKQQRHLKRCDLRILLRLTQQLD